MFLVGVLLGDFYVYSLVLKVREDQEKRRLEEEQQSQPPQQPGPQSGMEVPQSQPVPQHASYVPPQPNQHSSQMPAQPATQQSLQTSNYNTPQSQGVPYVPQSTGQIPVPEQSVAAIQPESEEPEGDQQLQHNGGAYQRSFVAATLESTQKKYLVSTLSPAFCSRDLLQWNKSTTASFFSFVYLVLAWASLDLVLNEQTLARKHKGITCLVLPAFSLVKSQLNLLLLPLDSMQSQLVAPVHSAVIFWALPQHTWQ